MIVVLAGGIGAARFLRGLIAAAPDEDITVIGNTADDITLHGLRVCPDLDTVMYTLGGGIHSGQGWGRADERFTVAEELASYGVGPDWFTLGDRDIATHLVRTQLLDAGAALSDVTKALCARWQPGVVLLPMTDDRVETHVVVDDDRGRRAVHFQEYWVRMRAAVPAESVAYVGIDGARPAPGVVEAIAGADAVILAPSNPVVSIGPILAVAGVADALRSTAAPVVGVSPIVAGAPVRGMADRMLAAIGVPVDAGAVGIHYGSRRTGGGILDGWLVDTADAPAVAAVEAAGIVGRAVPLLMNDDETTRALAVATRRLAEGCR